MRVTMRTFQLAVRGLPDLRNAPQTMDFTMRGQTFTADVTPDPDGGSCATVRGRGDGFTEADTLPELRKGHAEVVELMVFGAGRPNGPGARRPQAGGSQFIATGAGGHPAGQHGARGDTKARRRLRVGLHAHQSWTA